MITDLSAGTGQAAASSPGVRSTAREVSAKFRRGFRVACGERCVSAHAEYHRACAPPHACMHDAHGLARKPIAVRQQLQAPCRTARLAWAHRATTQRRTSSVQIGPRTKTDGVHSASHKTASGNFRSGAETSASHETATSASGKRDNRPEGPAHLVMHDTRSMHETLEASSCTTALSSDKSVWDSQRAAGPSDRRWADKALTATTPPSSAVYRRELVASK